VPGHRCARRVAIALDTAAPDSFRHDAKVIGVVGVAHGLSHFFQLALPPLFPLLRAEFDASYAALGVLVGVFYVTSGVTQLQRSITSLSWALTVSK